MRKIITVLIVLIVLMCYSLLFSQESSQWRGKNRDGKYFETGLLKKWQDDGPKLLWHFDNLGAGHASACVTTDFVYTAGTENGDGFVIAFDHSGEVVWKTVYGKEWMEDWDGNRTTPMVNNGKLYMMSGYGKIVCLDAKSGKTIWQIDLMEKYKARNIQWGITENLVIDGEKLFCTAGGVDANVIALNKNTGKLIWKCKANSEKSAYNSPIIIKLQERTLLITMTEKSILGIDVSNGKLLWSFEHTNKYSVHANTPVFFEGMLYCVSGYGKGGVMLNISNDGSNVSEVWRDSSLDCKMGGIILLNGKIYGSGDYNRKWYCLDWNTGEELFSSKTMKKGNIIFADDMLYCYDQSGKIALIDPQNNNFEPLSQFKVPFGSKQHWSHLVINNKKLYVRHGNSLMVYSIAE